MALVVFEDAPSTNTPLSSNNLNNNFNELKTTTQTQTLLTSGWQLNSTTNKYEYTIQNSNITTSHKIIGDLDLDNQAKMTDGIIQTFSGYYKIITSELPTEAITIQLTIIKIQE